MNRRSLFATLLSCEVWCVFATWYFHGKQPDGSAKTREVKLVTVWTAEGRDKQGRPVRDRGSVSYNAAVESAASRD